MKLKDQVPVTVNGAYAYKVYIGTGTAKLQMIDENNAPVDIADTSTSASLQKRLDYSGKVQAVLTGDAVVYLSEIAL